MNATLAAEIGRLSPAEKRLLVEELWDQITEEPNATAATAWHDQVLAEDAARYAAALRGDSWANGTCRFTGLD